MFSFLCTCRRRMWILWSFLKHNQTQNNISETTKQDDSKQKKSRLCMHREVPVNSRTVPKSQAANMFSDVSDLMPDSLLKQSVHDLLPDLWGPYFCLKTRFKKTHFIPDNEDRAKAWSQRPVTLSVPQPNGWYNMKVCTVRHAWLYYTIALKGPRWVI